MKTLSKLIVIVLVLVATALSLVGTTFAQDGVAPQPGTYTVVNAGPDGAPIWNVQDLGAQLTSLNNGEMVEVIQVSDQDADGYYWGLLAVPENGYINMAFLEAAQPTDPFTGLPACELNIGEAVKYDNGAAPQEGQMWVFDPNVTGCLILFEGRLDTSKVHHIYILRGAEAEEMYNGEDGKFRYMEGSLWFYGRGTDMVQMSQEFHDAKRINMQRNGYDWPIWVHGADGNVMEYPAGTLLNVELPNNCQFAAPQRVSVHGIYDAGTGNFNASIGAEGCTTVAWVNGEVTQWQNALDNVEFTTIEAWLMPGLWDATQVQAWINTH